MARFLFCLCPEASHVYPSLPVACALQAAGHTVAYVTLPEFRLLLEQHDITYFPRETETSNSVNTPSHTALGESSAHAATLKAAIFRHWFIGAAATDARATAHAADAFRPDVLVHDQRSWGPILVAERRKLPLATLALTCSTLPGEDLSPFGLGLPPARDAATRARYAALRAQAEANFAGVKAEWNAIRHSRGLPAHAGPLATVPLSPYLLILPTVPAFDYNRADLPPQAHYVGACLWDPPRPLDGETAAWLSDLPNGMPLIVVSASTATIWRQFEQRRADRRSAGLVEAALAGLAAMDVAVLATLPFDHPLHAQPQPAQHDAARSRQHLVRFVPHAQVLPRAAVVITHGGFGTVTKALAHGLPLVVVPYAFDQPEVAQRVAQAGAGVRLDAATLTPAAVRDAVRALLRQSTYREQAQGLAALLSRHDGPAEAAALLTRLAATGQPVLRSDAPTHYATVDAVGTLGT